LKDVREIGARLGAGTVVDGSIRKSGSKLKIFVEMIDATNGEVCWAETYAPTLNGLFKVEEEIARAVAGALQVKLAPSRGLIRAAPNTEAYLLSLQGLHAWNRMSEEGLPNCGENIRTGHLFVPRLRAAICGPRECIFRSRLMGTQAPSRGIPQGASVSARGA